MSLVTEKRARWEAYLLVFSLGKLEGFIVVIVEWWWWRGVGEVSQAGTTKEHLRVEQYEGRLVLLPWWPHLMKVSE